MAETQAAPPVKEGLEGQDTGTATGTENGNDNGGQQTLPPQFTDEMALGWLKDKGIHVDNFETLKQKVDYVPPPPPPTDEEKTKAQKELEKKLVNLHLAKGGTPELYATLKTLVAADPKEIGIEKITKDLLEDGFSKEQVDAVIRKMHLQISDDELSVIEDEKERETLKKERDFGSKKQLKRGLYIQQQAKSYLDNLHSELQEIETEKEKMEQHSATVAEAIKNFPRKQTLEMGQVDGQVIAPVDFEVSEQALTEAETLLKDAKQFEQNLFNKDGAVNLDFLLPHLVKSFSYSDAVKRSYLTGADRQVAIFKGTFSEKVPDLGAARKPDGKGNVVASGKPQAAERPFAK